MHRRVMALTAASALARLYAHYGAPPSGLRYKNRFQLLVAAILSAQATDAQVNKATPELFKHFKNADDVAQSDLHTLERSVRSVGLWKTKARNIKRACTILVQQHHGCVPGTMYDLLALPGIGRKVANVILAEGFGKNEGMAIDTHAARVSFRLGLTQSKNRAVIERDLTAQVPAKSWGLCSNLLIAHGRTVCKARKPLCAECFLKKACPSAFTFNQQK